MHVNRSLPVCVSKITQLIRSFAFHRNQFAFEKEILRCEEKQFSKIHILFNNT